jgi:NAD(P)-dependent dehydrogenase (short-subunit alcohol dehydrogenase family)
MQNKKVALVTGAAGNLGKAVAEKFLKENYLVVGTIVEKNDFVSDDKNAETVLVDLSDEKSSADFVASTIKKYNQIDVAVLTVGGFAMGKIEDTKTSDINKQYKLNFETAYNIAQPVFVQMMKQNSGRIFLIGSKPGLDARNSKGMVAYGLSKSLIFRLAELMNNEAKGKNVVVNVIVPSTIDTPQNRKSMPDADFSKWTKAEAIADIILWHCSSEASVLREPIIKAYNQS